MIVVPILAALASVLALKFSGSSLDGAVEKYQYKDKDNYKDKYLRNEL